MWQGINVFLLVKFATHLFLEMPRIWKQNVLSQCFDRHGQFNPRVRQHNVGSAAQWREVKEPRQRAPHVFSESSPTQSKWLTAVSRHFIPRPLSPQRELSHYGIPTRPISQNTAQGPSTLTLFSVVVSEKHFNCPHYVCMCVFLFTAGIYRDFLSFFWSCDFGIWSCPTSCPFQS